MGAVVVQRTSNKAGKDMLLKQLNNQTDVEEVKGCYRLWKKCFGDSKAYMDYYFEHKLKDNEIYVLKEDEVVSMLHLNPFRMSLHGQEKTYHYIVGVATEEEKRGQGCMRQVLTHSLRKKHKERELFTYLMPAAKEIYLPYDFRYIYSQKRIVGNLVPGRLQKTELVVKPYGQLTEQEKEEAVSFVMEKLDEAFSLYTVRSKAYYERTSLEMQAAGGELVSIYEAGRLQAVCFYMLENGHMEVVETVTNPEKTEAVVNALFLHVQEVKPHKELEVVFLETHFLEAEKIMPFLEQANRCDQPIIMARILDVKAALKLLKAKNEDITIRIAVTDPIIAENEATYELRSSKSGTVLTVTKEPYDLKMDIATFTEFFFESKAVASLLVEYKTEQAKKMLEALTGCFPCYINEIV